MNKSFIGAHSVRWCLGSTTDPKIIQQAHSYADVFDWVLLCSDSSHTHRHVLAEPYACADAVSVGKCCILLDAVVENLLPGYFADGSWDVSSNPMTALWEYLRSNLNFLTGKEMDDKLLTIATPNGCPRASR